MKKHAYLLIVHNEFYLLQQLVEVLDDERNDIYIHVDKKVKDFDFEGIKCLVRKSQIYFVKRIRVSWGGDSMVKCEYVLLKEAFARGYQYYHLLSGVDFPIKSQAYIHDFFDQNKGTSYLHIIKDSSGDFDTTTQRNTEYRFLQNLIGRNAKPSNFLFRLERRNIKLQRRLSINRLKSCPLKMYKGSQWFSITHELAKEILQQEGFVKKYFYKSYCPDELFVETIAMNSLIKNKILNNYMRHIDWKRGQPYIFQLKDFNELIESDALFARKFSCATEDGKELVARLKEYVSCDSREH